MSSAPALLYSKPAGRILPWVLLIGATVLAFGVSLTVGQGDESDPELREALLSIRGYRAVGAFLAGSALAVAGVLVQGLFANPLASPSVIGTTAGAHLGGKLSFLALHLLAQYSAVPRLGSHALLPIGCLLGAWVALVLLLLATRLRDDLVVVLLTGFLLSSLFLSIGGLVSAIAMEKWELARAVMGFALGSVSSVGPLQIWLALPLVVIGIGSAWAWSRPLDVMLTGEEEARTMGLEVRALRRWVLVWTAVLTAGAVAIGGNVNFVGLVVPHALRPIVGVRHHRLMPACALAGGAFVLSCDVLCRMAPTRSEAPLGVVTGLVGAPAFLWLLMRYRSEVRA